MTTNTVENKALSLARLLLCVSAVLLGSAPLHADTVLGPFVPIFKGIERAVGTNTPDGTGMPNLQVVNILKVDLTDPDIQIMATPRIANWVPESRETAAMTVGNFVSTYKLQVGINANDFRQGYGGSPPYNLAAGTALNLTGVLISKGQIVSSQQSPSYDQYNCAMFFDTNKQVSYSMANWPAAAIDGIYNAFCGTHPIVVDGVNVGYDYLVYPYTSIFVHQVQPRTVFGSSQDSHYLFLCTIDGRQSGYSDGALDWEAGEWMLRAGAYNAINMDGGGSTTLDLADSTGKIVALNRSSSYTQYGYERTVGAQLGVFAKPVSGFINDVSVAADNTAATITWTTTGPATTQVRYGLDTNLSSTTIKYFTLTTNHYALLQSLLPNTTYYFQVISTQSNIPYYSSTFAFTTSNYVAEALPIFGIDSSWRYCWSNLDTVTTWKSKTFNDSGWTLGNGAFWADLRGAQPGLPPLGTEMACDPNNYPYPFGTYYFRTHFTYTNKLAGVSLLVTAYCDDGAVFYVNGSEAYRLRMADYPTIITYTATSTNYPGSGNATVADIFELKGKALTNLVQGDNVLAVEVHNYKSNSPDITFGMSLDATPQYDIPPQITVTPSNNVSVLSWDRGGFTLYQSTSLTGSWTGVPGPCGSVCASPWAVTNSSSAKFFRLQR